MSAGTPLAGSRNLGAIQRVPRPVPFGLGYCIHTSSKRPKLLLVKKFSLGLPPIPLKKGELVFKVPLLFSAAAR